MRNYSFQFKSVLFSLLVLVSISLAGPGWAATYCVDDFGDGPPNAGDCPADCTSSNGNCSLRDAIEAANANGNLDTIDIPAGTVNLTEVGDGDDSNASGDLDINRDVTLQGAGMNQTIVEWDSNLSDTDKDRLFDVDPQANAAKVVINDLTAQNGAIFDLAGAQGGGAGFRQSDGSTLELRGVKVKDNVVDETGSDGGGGIYSLGSLEIYQSSIEGNKSRGGGAGILVATASGELIMEDSTVSGNETTEEGYGPGGVFISVSQWEISNSTISNNTALGGSGGLRSDGTGSLTNVTVTENTAMRPGGGISQGGIGGMTIKNSIVAGNTSGEEETDCNDTSNNMTSAGSNLIGDGTGCPIFVDEVDNDQVGTGVMPIDPLLGPLQNNGGMTETHLLLTDSPAREGVSGGNCPPPDQDQRGQVRPIGPLCDIGAVEMGSSDLSVSLSIDPTGTLNTGDAAFLDLEVENLGPDKNFSVTLVVDLPTGVTVQSIDPSEDCELTGSQLICIFASMENGDIEFITLAVTFTLPGNLTTTATVTGTGDDPDSDNNSASVTTTVIGLPTGGCQLGTSKGSPYGTLSLIIFGMILLHRRRIFGGRFGTRV